jgi:hypothetical protein
MSILFVSCAFPTLLPKVSKNHVGFEVLGHFIPIFFLFDCFVNHLFQRGP